MSNDAQGLFGEDGSIGESGPGESDMKHHMSDEMVVRRAKAKFVWLCKFLGTLLGAMLVFMLHLLFFGFFAMSVLSLLLRTHCVSSSAILNPIIVERPALQSDDTWTYFYNELLRILSIGCWYPLTSPTLAKQLQDEGVLDSNFKENLVELGLLPMEDEDGRPDPCSAFMSMEGAIWARYGVAYLFCLIIHFVIKFVIHMMKTVGKVYEALKTAYNKKNV
jgi:hypothetical protein